MRVVVKHPNKSPEVLELSDVTYFEDIKEIIGGYVENVYLTKRIALILDEEGKLKNKQPNVLFCGRNGVADVGVGTIVAIAVNPPEYESLTDDEIEYVKGWFEKSSITWIGREEKKCKFYGKCAFFNKDICEGECPWTIKSINKTIYELWDEPKDKNLGQTSDRTEKVE